MSITCAPNGEVELDGRPAKRVKLSPGTTAQKATDLNGSVDADFDFKQTQQISPVIDEVIKKESDVGITVFVSEGQAALRGLLKKRYTDFLVREITPEGQVLHLKSLRAFKAEGDDAVPAAEAAVDSKESATNGRGDQATEVTAPATVTQAVAKANELMEISLEDRDKLSEHFSEDVVTQTLALYASITSNPKSKPSDHPTVRTPFTTDRGLRGQIHQEIRRIFSSLIESQTDHSGTLILSAAPPSRPSTNKSARNKPGKLSWAERGGEHLHFNLYKENRDSMEMINLLARLMKMNPRDFKMAGTKDRRAATVQKVSVQKLDSERLAGLNKTLRGAAVGDFEYKSRSLELGELSGNEFHIALRECELENTLNLNQLKLFLTESMTTLYRNGFLNYYGLQRFGTFGIRTDEIGAKILQGDFESACNMLLDFNPKNLEAIADETGNTIGRDDILRAEAISIFRNGGRINTSLDKMPRRFAAETNLIRTLGKNPSDFLGALLSITKAQRTLYPHAYQSRIWNMAASERWNLFGATVMEGDLVLTHEHKDKQAPPTLSDTVDADGEVVITASANDSSRTNDDIFERARHLSATEAQSGQYSIFDIVLPTPGWDVEYPKNESGAFYKTYMATEEGGGLDPYEMRRKQKDFSLSGSYRKVMARIGREFGVEVRRYGEVDGILLETDLGRVDRERGVEQRAMKEDGKGDGKEDGSMETEGDRLAVILKFQLGSSQYATMALRELSRGGVREWKPEFSGGR